MFVFLNGSSFCLLAWGLLPEASRARMDWIHWLQAAAPLGLVAGLGALAAIFLLLRPRAGAAPSREQVDLQIAVLGPPSRQELSMVVVLALTLAGWVFGSLAGIDPGVVALLGLVAAVVTGNLERGALQELDWNFLIYFGVALSMADLTVALGLDRAAAAAVGAGLGQLGVSPLVYVLALAVLSFALRLVLPQTQGVLILALAFIPTASVVGVDPWIVVVTILATSGQWFIPSETNAYLVAYSAAEGRLFSHAQARRVAFGYAVVVLVGLALSIPYWHALGLL
jgi:di/tricarboxylate transporter